MMRRMGPAARQKAIEERIPEEFRKHFRKAFATSVDLGMTRAMKRPAAALGTAHSADVWRGALSKRQRVDAAASEDQLKKYREQLLADRARARWRFGVDRRHPAGEAVDNDTGLDPPTHSKLAIDFDHCHWCRSNSWGMCATCGTDGEGLVARLAANRASEVLSQMQSQGRVQCSHAGGGAWAAARAVCRSCTGLESSAH